MAVTFNLFHLSSGLFVVHYHANIITVVLQYSVKSGTVMPPSLALLPRIIFAILGQFCIQMKFWNHFSTFVKYANDISIEISINLHNNFGINAIFTVFVLPIHELKLFLFSEIHVNIFFRVLKFSLCRSYTFFVRLIAKC